MGRGGHLGELEALVLAAVARVGADATGTDVYVEIEARTGRDPTVAGVHVTLRRLADKGLVTSTVAERSPRGGRPRRLYRLSPAGVKKLAEFKEMWRKVWDGLDLPGAAAQ